MDSSMAGLDDIAAKLHESLQSIKQREAEVKDMEDAVHAHQTKVESYNQEVENERKRVAEWEEKLGREKEEMQQIDAAENDVVELNVQGVTMSTLRKTLTQIPETRLAYFFNGCWEDKLEHDREGRVFLDVIPTQFRTLLDYLTNRRLAKHPESVPVPWLSGEEALSFQLMVGYFGLEGALYGGPRCFSRQLKSHSSLLSDDALRVKHEGDSMGFVLGEGCYSNERVEFVLKIQKLDKPWMFLGVLEENGSLPADNSFNNNAGAYGWAGLGGVWVAGQKQCSTADIPIELLCDGAIARIMLDCRDACSELALILEDEQYVLTGLPEGSRWRLHVNMVGAGDEVHLMDVKKHEL